MLDDLIANDGYPNSKGDTPAMNKKTCDLCGGSGELPDGEGGLETCPECDGEGTAEREETPQ